MSSGSALSHQQATLEKKDEENTSIKNIANDSSQSDVNKLKVEADGSWKRPASSFRNTIEPGGEFPPEEGLKNIFFSIFQ